MEQYAVVNGKKLRKGYTTGSCAAAASKAAVKMLVSGMPVHQVQIDTPAGVRLDLPVVDIDISPVGTTCAIVKDAGDDPDVTNGIKVFAKAEYLDAAAYRGMEPSKHGSTVCTEGYLTRETEGGGRIVIGGGTGIGTVTLPGLSVGVGYPAINPVPVRMIFKEVEEVLPSGCRVKVTLSVPGGEEIGKKTFNPRLGILGGISILGTTGIVNPMSEEAWVDSIALELSMLRARGEDRVILVPGNFGEDFAVHELGLPAGNMVKISNFVGTVLDRCKEFNFQKVLMVGHIGKLVKVAGGIFHTHSAMADGRMEILAAYAGARGADARIIAEILECTTTELAMDILEKHGLQIVYTDLAYRITHRCRLRCGEGTDVGTVLFGNGNRLLAMDEEGERMVGELAKR